MLHSNALLAFLSASDTAALRPHLKATHLQQKTALYEVGDTIQTIYFPINGAVSLPLSFGSFLAVLVVSVVHGTPGTNKSKTGHSRFKTGH